MPRRVNAVFKGGGAKGVAYAGALRACEEAGVEVAGVAGSSAGAITAVLVACGYDSDEITDLLPSALSSVGSPIAAALPLPDQVSCPLEDLSTGSTQ